MALGLAIGGCAGTNGSTIGSTSSYSGDMLQPQNQGQQQAVSSATAALQKGDAPAVTSGEDALGLNLFQQLTKEKPDKNICISPVSIGSLLSMLYDGANGDTKKQIGAAMDFGKMTPTQIDEANKNLDAVLTNLDPKKVDLNIANSVWVDSGTALSQDFVQKDQQYYSAKVSTLDFKAPESPGTINDWVKSSTKGKIPRIVDSIPPDARIYVINAVYFNGSWQRPFDKSRTMPQTFTLTDGTEEQTPMMTQSGSFGYFTNSDASGIALPYGSGRLEMDFILPGAGQTVSNLEKKLAGGSLATWMKASKLTPIQVTVPTFKFDYSVSLNETLKAAGLANAFDPIKADFTAILDKSAPSAAQKLYLSEVKHKVYIDVNELGTEAAAVTSGQISAMATMMPGAKFTANHPFLYVVRDNQTGAILFAGSLMDPTQSTNSAPDKKDAPSKS